MNKTLAKLIKLLLIILPISTYAQNITDLYTGYAKVPDQTEKLRTQQIPTLLSNVLIKVSGNSKVAEIPKIKEQLTKASDLVEQYGYQQAPNSNEQILTVNFNEKQVDQLLRESGQALWRHNRPLTLIWLAIQDEQGDKEIVGMTAANDVPKLLQQQAAMRGVPVYLPILDLQDLNAVSVDDVWAPFPWVIENASKRYHANGELIGKISKPANPAIKQAWQADWLLQLDGSKMDWQSYGDSVDELVSAAVDEMADAMAARYAVLSSNSGQMDQLIVAVQGIHDMGGYAKISQYLQSLNSVTEFQVDSIDNDQVKFNLVVAGGVETLTQILAMDNLLLPVKQTEQSGVANLTYQMAS